VEADDIAEGTGNYPYNRRERDGGAGGENSGYGSGAGSYSGAAAAAAAATAPPSPRKHPNPNGPHDRSPLPASASGLRLVNLQLSRPGDEMTGLPGTPTSFSHGGSPHFVIGNAYVLRVTSDAAEYGPTVGLYTLNAVDPSKA
jgi:hypothetical protein